MSKLPPVPRNDPDQDTGAPLATSTWMATSTVIEAMRYIEGDLNAANALLLGKLEDIESSIEKGHEVCLVGFQDDRHIITIAGSRGGKGDSLIIPNELTYPGSLVTIDAKGEHASVTGGWRKNKLGQKCIVLDPYRVAKVSPNLRGSYNPLQAFDLNDSELVEDVSALADALITPSGGEDRHWDESARAFLKGVILWVLLCAGDEPKLRSFAILRELLTVGQVDLA